MKELLKELYDWEIDQSRLNFDHDPEYQAYYTQVEALWEEGDMPAPLFHLLETSNLISFAHGFQLGARLARWVGAG
ncbi:MAG: hypothetical protein HFF48_04325 [Lawsonibacter sp.]|jgi:hypothetical protein|nr:hypothetical protein [Lawsonibacter sp.]